MSTLKAWVLYVILTWSPGPLLPDNQKTILLQFKSHDECSSIANQVSDHVKAMPLPFTIKALECYPCREVFKERCPDAAPANNWAPRVRKN